MVNRQGRSLRTYVSLFCGMRHNIVVSPSSVVAAEQLEMYLEKNKHRETRPHASQVSSGVPPGTEHTVPLILR